MFELSYESEPKFFSGTEYNHSASAIRTFTAQAASDVMNEYSQPYIKFSFIEADSILSGWRLSIPAGQIVIQKQYKLSDKLWSHCFLISVTDITSLSLSLRILGATNYENLLESYCRPPSDDMDVNIADGDANGNDARLILKLLTEPPSEENSGAYAALKERRSTVEEIQKWVNALKSDRRWDANWNWCLYCKMTNFPVCLIADCRISMFFMPNILLWCKCPYLPCSIHDLCIPDSQIATCRANYAFDSSCISRPCEIRTTWRHSSKSH